MTDFQLEISDNEQSPAAGDIHRLLSETNLASFGAPNRQPLVISIRHEGQLVAGLRGVTHWGWLYITHLWVAEGFRGRKLGKRCLEQAEAEAVKRNCPRFYVDTFSPAAVRFYESSGYVVIGTLPDFPPGSARFFLMKTQAGQ